MVEEDGCRGVRAVSKLIFVGKEMENWLDGICSVKKIGLLCMRLRCIKIILLICNGKLGQWVVMASAWLMHRPSIRQGSNKSVV